MTLLSTGIPKQESTFLGVIILKEGPTVYSKETNGVKRSESGYTSRRFKKNIMLLAPSLLYLLSGTILKIKLNKWYPPTTREVPSLMPLESSARFQPLSKSQESVAPPEIDIPAKWTRITGPTANYISDSQPQPPLIFIYAVYLLSIVG